MEKSSPKAGQAHPLEHDGAIENLAFRKGVAVYFIKSYIDMLTAQKVKDLTTSELKALIRETVAEAIDPEALKESMEIISDKQLTKQIRSSVRAYRKGKTERFVPLKEIRKRHAV